MEDALEHLRYPVGRYEAPANFTAQQKRGWISEIKALPSWLDLCIENLDHHQLQTPYREGGWTIHQVIHHIADSHVNAYIRLKLALTENNPTIKPYNEALWANLSDTISTPVNVSVTLVHALHYRWVAQLEHLSDDEWLRTYYHPEHQRDFPIWEMTAMYAWHGRHHTAHIQQLRERMNW